ncbi:hypothetical protein BaRGS_00025609, partial [Batillaria attramentaria]
DSHCEACGAVTATDPRPLHTLVLEYLALDLFLTDVSSHTPSRSCSAVFYPSLRERCSDLSPRQTSFISGPFKSLKLESAAMHGGNVR